MSHPARLPHLDHSNYNERSVLHAFLYTGIIRSDKQGDPLIMVLNRLGKYQVQTNLWQ
jgi:hypothetical protein